MVNPEEAPTVKLIFYMYLYGYSTSDIAAALTELGRKTYLGNIKWDLQFPLFRFFAMSVIAGMC